MKLTRHCFCNKIETVNVSFSTVQSTIANIITLMQIVARFYAITLDTLLYDLVLPISKKLMFRNYRFVTTEDILKCYHRVFISTLSQQANRDIFEAVQLFLKETNRF